MFANMDPETFEGATIMRLKLAFIICLLTTRIFALDPPQPIKGAPTILSRKGVTLQSGETIFSFTLPVDWGMGETLASQESANFTLFPKSGGFGSTIQVNRFQNEMLANEKVEELKNTFTSTSPIVGGFESVLKKAYYACYANEVYVVQIWYSLLNKSAASAAHWEQLKRCVSVSKAREQIEDTTWVPIKEIPPHGWVCNHPNNKLHILFKSNFLTPSKPSQDPHATYLLEIEDRDSSGFFFVKWDQENLNSSGPYEVHLNEMKTDILRIESRQQFESVPVFIQEEGWAFLKGHPYTVMSLSGDGFLFGFALKNKYIHRSFDINKYVERVKWWED